MGLAALPTNVIEMPQRERRLCSCGCGQFTSGRMYAGKPGTREYNMHCNRAYRQRKSSRDNHVINHYEAMLQSQNEMILQLKELVTELRRAPRPIESAPAPRPAAPVVDAKIEVTQAKADTGSAQNFIGDLCKLQGWSTPKVVQSTGNAKALAGANVALSAPDFEEDLL